jgi:hypothetical protein
MDVMFVAMVAMLDDCGATFIRGALFGRGDELPRVL